jgi:hypothetical protein
MRTIRRVIFGSVVSLLAVAIVSDASAGGIGAMLLLGLFLGWFEWRAWKKPNQALQPTPGSVTPRAQE